MDYLNWCDHYDLDIELDFPSGRIQPYIDSLERYSIYLVNGRSYNVHVMPTTNGMQVGQISRIQHDLLMAYIERFLKWAVNRYISPRYLASTVDFVATKQAILWSLGARTNTRYARSNIGRPEERDFKSLTEDELNAILNAAYPQSPENPFQSHDIRVRNYLIVVLLKQLGLRIGELIGLTLQDLQLVAQGRYYLCVRKNADITDPRHVRATLKTIFSERTLALPSDLAKSIERYITSSRKKYINQENHHTYIFVAEKTGAPLSVSAIDKILNELRMAAIFVGQERPEKISAHMFRHTWASNHLEYLVEGKNIDIELAKDELRRLGGWSDKSQMPSRYARRFIEKIANAANMRRIEEEYESFSGDDDET